MARRSMIGTDFDSCIHHWSTQGLNYYVCAKLHWNPDLDIDTLIDDYCRTGFGSGAGSVKGYFLKLEALTDHIATAKLRITLPYTPDVIEELRGYLDAAGAATRDEPAAHARVAFLRTGLEYTDGYAEIFRVARAYEASGDRLTPEWRRRFREPLDKNWLVSRDIFEQDHLAVNVLCVAWGSWAYFGRFGRNARPWETMAHEHEDHAP